MGSVLGLGFYPFVAMAVRCNGAIADQCGDCGPQVFYDLVPCREKTLNVFDQILYFRKPALG